MTLTPDDLADLKDLLTSRGWELFSQHADEEWGPVAFAGKVAGIGDPALDPRVALAQLQQATVSQREVFRLLKWPKDQIQALKAKTQPGVTMSRRGAGL